MPGFSKQRARRKISFFTVRGRTNGFTFDLKHMRDTLPGMLSLYKRTLSPWVGSHCRFHPPCSDYAVGCIQRHGWMRGFALAFYRLARCQPWSKGGFDPVPGTAGPENEL